MTLPTAQPVGVHHYWLGDTVVTALSDGWFDGSFDMLTDPNKDRIAEAERAAFRANPPRMQVNTFLIRRPGHDPVLIDAGTGNKWASTLGQQHHALMAAGLTPSAIRTVLMTHLHIDHCGGLTDPSGAATFDNAELVLAAQEAAFWLDGKTPPEGMADAFALARATTAPYAGRTRHADAGEVAPGITLVPLHGHTPGHSGFRLDANGQSMLFIGDIVHMAGVQFALPDVCVMFDADQDAARATRRRVLDEAATERTLLAGNHLDFPAFGYVERAGDGFRWIPAQWRYAA